VEKVTKGTRGRFDVLGLTDFFRLAINPCNENRKKQN